MYVYCMHNLPTYLTQVTLDLEAAAAAHRDVLLRQHTTHDTDTANTLTVAPLQTFQPVYLQVRMYVWVRVCPHTVWACAQAGWVPSVGWNGHV